MIRRITREQLDVERYNACIEAAKESSIFGFSWYLDIVCETWEVFVLNDYQAVMPFPVRKKLMISYVYPPLWVLELGVFSKEVVCENEFMISLLDEFKYVEYASHTHNQFSMFTQLIQVKTRQVLDLKQEYSNLYKKYNRNRKRELTKAKKYDLIESWTQDPKVLIDNFKSNIGPRLSKIKQQDYDNLEKLMRVCIQKRVGELLCVYNSSNELVSTAFFLKYKNKVTELVCSSSINRRNNGANTFMNDRAIFKYQPHYEVFDFGGSSMKNIRKYYLSFGAKDHNYSFVKYNNLPWLLRFFKK